MTIQLIEKAPSVADYNRLRQAMGWPKHEAAEVRRALANSLYCVTAQKDGEVIGMGRVIGDGILVCYLQDIVVLTGYQKQGIGKRLMDKLMTYVHRHYRPQTVVGLMATQGKERFYEGWGFVRRPNHQLGEGMSICL